MRKGRHEDHDRSIGTTRRGEGVTPMTIERVYEEGLVKEWHGNQI